MVVTRSKNHGNAYIMRCDGCLMNISNTVWMQCISCGIDICLLCFHKNIPIGQHEYMHPYHIMKSLSFPAEFKNWEFLEELLFIDGTIMHGIGNWEDVAVYVGRKTTEEIENHFMDVFKINNDRNNEEVDLEDKEDNEHVIQSNPLSKEISGYMPLRGDFEIEYSNDAESVMKDISFTKTDTQLEKEMKESLIDAYKRVLLKRKLFRHLVFNKGLLQAKKRINAEKALCAAGKDLLAKMKPLLKILTVKEFNILFEGLYLEICIKKRIKMLSQQSTHERKYDAAEKKVILSEDILITYLSQKEINICNILSLSPSVYLLLKETAVVNSLCSEKDRKPLSKLFQGITEQKLSQLTEFFVQNGWIDQDLSPSRNSSPFI